MRIRHRRSDPLRYAFVERGWIWLVDVDDLPKLPRWATRMCRFSAADHLGASERTIRRNIDDILTAAGRPSACTILMLTNPRILGYVFNPLTIFYCLGRDGQVETIVAEVHNTYGGRHGYVLVPDELGRMRTAKRLRVSPFHPLEGSYTIVAPAPTDRVVARVTLHLPDCVPFTASISGSRTRANTLWSALRTPLATRAVMFQIKKHGLILYAKGLRPLWAPQAPTSDRERASM